MTYKSSPVDRPTRPCRVAGQSLRKWLTGLIREVHAATRGPYGSRLVHAEPTLGMRGQVSACLVEAANALLPAYGPAHQEEYLEALRSIDLRIGRLFTELLRTFNSGSNTMSRGAESSPAIRSMSIRAAAVPIS
jgi:hypothetical protein